MAYPSHCHRIYRLYNMSVQAKYTGCTQKSHITSVLPTVPSPLPIIPADINRGWTNLHASVEYLKKKKKDKLFNAHSRFTLPQISRLNVIFVENASILQHVPTDTGDLWWKMWQWSRLLSEYFSFLPWFSMQQCSILKIHSSVTNAV